MTRLTADQARDKATTIDPMVTVDEIIQLVDGRSGCQKRGAGQ